MSLKRKKHYLLNSQVYRNIVDSLIAGNTRFQDVQILDVQSNVFNIRFNVESDFDPS